MGKGTRAKRTQRIMESSLGDFIRECQSAETDRDNFRRNWSGGFGYRNYGDGAQYITTPLGTHRDADAREASNWSVILPAMEKADSFDHLSEDPGVKTHIEGSCLNGWNESLLVRVDDAVAVKEAMEFVHALSDYPILDEFDFAEREWEENHPDGYTCYAEDGCSCADGEHNRLNDESTDEHAGCRAWLAGELMVQSGETKAGWRSFDGGDVDEEFEETDDPELIAHCTMDSKPGKYLDSLETYHVHDNDRGGLVWWSWYCGADGCGQWIDATQADLRIIRRHHLFSDLPPAPTVSLVKGVGGTQDKLF